MRKYNILIVSVLAIGNLFRNFRIDELPQIWNILKGEMSWVGPRPEVDFYFEKSSINIKDSGNSIIFYKSQRNKSFFLPLIEEFIV